MKIQNIFQNLFFQKFEIYEDLDLKNYGLNKEKAFVHLQKSWNVLTLPPEEKKKDYVFKFNNIESEKNKNNFLNKIILKLIC